MVETARVKKQVFGVYIYIRSLAHALILFNFFLKGEIEALPSNTNKNKTVKNNLNQIFSLRR